MVPALCQNLPQGIHPTEAAHWLQVFRDFHGPTRKAFAALDAAGQASLATDITALLHELNIGGGDMLVVPGEYMEVVVAKRSGSRLIGG